MNDIPISLVGNVVQDVRKTVTKGGLTVVSLRVACNSRRLNRTTGNWEDGETNFVTVNCWRNLAENVASSINRGDSVVVTGRLRVREWSNDERSGISVEVEASSVGHDLNRGTASFVRTRKDLSASDNLVEMASAAGIDLAVLEESLPSEAGLSATG